MTARRLTPPSCNSGGKGTDQSANSGFFRPKALALIVSMEADSCI
jgi:hypothetical protein